MPEMNRALVVRPSFEPATYLGSLALQHAVDHLAAKGFTLEDLRGDDAIRDKVLDALSRLDPIWCILLGHGNPSTYTGQRLNPIFWTCDCKELGGRIVYALSCFTAMELGPDAVENKGCRCYIGYDREFAWTQEKFVDPLEDKYGKAFFEPVLELICRLADGATTGEAFKASIDKWNEWIEYWSKSEDPVAPLVLQLLIHDRDCQRLLGDEEAKVYAPAPPIWWLTAMMVGCAPIGAVLGIIGGNELSKMGEGK